MSCDSVYEVVFLQFRVLFAVSQNKKKEQA